jgi:hypothetical protein
MYDFGMFKAPNQFPSIDLMASDIHASHKQIAKLIGVTEATLRRYRRTGNAPRSVYLALFWETRWGRSAADCEAANFGALQKSRADGLARQLDKAYAMIERLESELSRPLEHRAANLPMYSTKRSHMFTQSARTTALAR